MGILITMEKTHDDVRGAIYTFAVDQVDLGSVWLDKKSGSVELIEIEPEALKRRFEINEMPDLLRALRFYVESESGEKQFAFRYQGLQRTLLIEHEDERRIAFRLSDSDNDPLASGVFDKQSGGIADLTIANAEERLHRIAAVYFVRVRRKLQEHHAKGVYPDKTQYAS